MSDKDSGGPVYPVITTGEVIKGAGISRRDWLAGLVMQGFLASGVPGWEQSVELSYKIADAMIAEGKK